MRGMGGGREFSQEGWKDQEAFVESPEGSRSRGRRWEALPEGWEGSGGHPEGPGGVGRPSQRAGRGGEA